MNELHLPWLELVILTPLLGAMVVSRLRDGAARKRCVIVSGVALALAVGAWQDYRLVAAAGEAHDRWDLTTVFFGRDIFVIDQLNAPLLPLAALLYLMTSVATMRTKLRRFSFAWTLVSEAILLATLCCREPWGVIFLLAAGVVPPWIELRERRKPTGVYSLHMALFVVLLVAGWSLVEWSEPETTPSLVGGFLLTGAVLLRCGIVPVHCWMTDLFEHATFGTALLFVTPMAGAYAAVTLVLPVAPDWALRTIALVSLITAVYAAGMALVQHEARRFFCYLFLSHSSLVLVGLEIATPIGLTGALCVWLSVGLALTGFGLTLRSMEARLGRVSLSEYHGMHEHAPMLAAFFLLTGLASVGFPGTFGFIGMEMLVDGAVQVYPHVGIAVAIAAALNGIAVVRAYFAVFTGKRHLTTISLRSGGAERWAVLSLAALILGGGLFPQPGITSRYRAAQEIIESRPKSPASSSEPAHVIGSATGDHPPGSSRPSAIASPRLGPSPSAPSPKSNT